MSEAAHDLLNGLLPERATDAKRALQDRRASGYTRAGGGGWHALLRLGQVQDKDSIRRLSARAEVAAACGTTATPLVPWTIDDLRTTVTTGLQRLGVRLEVTEAVPIHISGSRGGGAGVHQRDDWAAEKRAALDAWATHVLATIEGPSAGGNVVSLSLVG